MSRPRKNPAGGILAKVPGPSVIDGESHQLSYAVMTAPSLPRLCVITPSFRQGRFIKRTIDSVLSQGVACDYVVVDGGSDDETVDILKSYGERLRWVSEADRGQSDAINKGLRMTDAEIIGWLNSDDVYFPGTLARVQQFFAAHPEFDMVYGRAHHIDEDDRWIEDYPTEPWDFDRLRKTCYLSQPAVFFRRRLIDRVGPIDETLHYCMDYDLWLRVAQAGLAVAYLDDCVLAGSRLHAAAKTLAARLPVHREINDMLKRRLGTVPDAWLSGYAHVVLRRHGWPEHGWRFRTGLCVHASLASLRWNRSVRPSLLRMIAAWLFAEVKNRVAAALRRQFYAARAWARHFINGWMR